MTTKTKTPKTQAPKSKTTKKTAISRCEWIDTCTLPVDAIVASPYQPRQEFDEAELMRLGQNIREHGLLASLWVRMLQGGKYELLDGERRWRAAVAEKISELRCDIYVCSDAQARGIGLTTVLFREDLNAIDRAAAFQRSLDAGDYPGQKELAAAYGLDQSTVSNLLRLLKLPAEWQRRIISREMSERHARAVLPYLKYPSIMASFEEFFSLNASSENPGLPTVADWEESTVPGIVKDATRSMTGMHGDGRYYHPRFGSVTIFEPDAFQEKQLKIIKLGDEQLATNVELWEELQESHLKLLAEKKREGVGDEGLGAGEESQEASTEPAMAADDDENGDEDLGSQKTLAERFEEEAQAPSPKPQAPQSDFYRWRLAWQRKLIAEAVTTAGLSDLVKIVTLGLCVWKIPHEGLEQLLDEALRDSADTSRRKSITQNLLDTSYFHLEKVLADLVADWFWNSERGPSGDVPAEDVEALVFQMEIDLSSEWQQGNILALRALLDCYDEAGLVALAKKWKVQVDPKWGHDGIAGKLEHAIGNEEIDTPLPAEVVKAKAK